MVSAWQEELLTCHPQKLDEEKKMSSLFGHSKGVLTVVCKHFILSEFHLYPSLSQMRTTKTLKYIFTVCFPNALQEKKKKTVKAQGTDPFHLIRASEKPREKDQRLLKCSVSAQVYPSDIIRWFEMK